MLRRSLLWGASLSTSSILLPPVAQAQDRTAAFDAAFGSYTSDERALEDARGFRELGFRDSSITEAQQGMTGRRSNRAIDQRAIDLIVASEVSSRNA